MGDAAELGKPLKVAIVGGGIGGLSLLLGILNHCDPQTIQPHVYEAAHAFSEIGAGVGFLPNSVRAMYAVDPKLHEAYSRIADQAPDTGIEGDNKWAFSRTFMGVDGRGGTNTLKAFDEICTLYNDNRLRHAHRATFQNEMVKLLPGGFEAGLVSFGKKCTDIQEHDGGVTIIFADGTREDADAVIGCDGVKSRVRNILYGEQASCEPQFTGKYAYRGLVPFEAAFKTVGHVAMNQAAVVGYGGHLVTFPVNQRSSLNIVAYRGAADWDHGDDWVVPATTEEVLKDFKDFSEPIKRLLSLIDKPDKWAMFDLPPLNSYVRNGKICLLGDCAHASHPHQGAGAGMAIEDAAVLSRLLGEIGAPDATSLTHAFAAYDAVRRNRTQKVVTSSRSAGVLLDLERPGVGDDIKPLRESLMTRWNWIWDLDIDAHCQEAIEIMNQAHAE